jgi:hypothetical protein
MNTLRICTAGLVLGDTDYRQLSYLHRGGLPGIDVAYLLGGAAYHTDRDTLAAIRPGVLQVSCGVECLEWNDTTMQNPSAR